MRVTRFTVNIETDASGDFTKNINPPDGFFLQVRYVVDGSDPLDTGADLTIAEKNTGVNLLTMENIGTSSFTRMPRAFVSNAADGSASTTESEKIPTHDEVTVTIAEGGANKVGTLYLYFGHER